MVHHNIAFLEAVHTPPPAFSLPPPHTLTLASYLRTEPAELHARIRHATIIVTCVHPLDAVALSPDVTPHLQLIAVMASGTDCVDLDACRRRGIRVVNCPHANVQCVAEHTLGLYFAARRRTLLLHERAVGTLGDGGEWVEKDTLTQHMRVGGRAPLNCGEEVVGIVGYGAVGKRIAQLTGLLGMKVIIAGRKGETAPPAGRVPFADVLATSTVVVLSLPRMPSTMNLLSAIEFQTMRPEAVLINVSRGGIVDEVALLSALREGRIAGAATDVLVKEPALGGERAESVLLGPEARGLNLTVTPHVAWFGEKTMENYQRILKENVERWVAGQEQNVVA